MRSLQKARDFFVADRFAMVTSGIEIEEVDDGYAKCSMKVDERHVNATGHVMGGLCLQLQRIQERR